MPPISSLRALRVDPFSSRLLMIDAALLRRADADGIASTGYRSRTLGSSLAVLVNEQGRAQGEPLNLWATIIVHTFEVPRVVFGSAVVYGIRSGEAQMRSVGTLTDDQVRVLAKAVVGPLDLAVFERLETSLASHAGAASYLANFASLAPLELRRGASVDGPEGRREASADRPEGRAEAFADGSA